jgi:hypothetical protein
VVIASEDEWSEWSEESVPLEVKLAGVQREQVRKFLVPPLVNMDVARAKEIATPLGLGCLSTATESICSDASVEESDTMTSQSVRATQTSTLSEDGDRRKFCDCTDTEASTDNEIQSLESAMPDHFHGFVSAALQKWCNRQVKADLDELMLDLPAKLGQCTEELGHIGEQLDAGFYDEEVTVNSEASYIVRAFDVYEDINECLEFFESRAENDTLKQLLSSRRELLQNREAAFEESLEELSDRLLQNGCDISDIAWMSMEILASTQISILTSVNALCHSMLG